MRVGRYEVLAHIATGGMGAVYRAVDRDLKREVALKILNPELVVHPGIMERFRREARAAASLHHENIVGVYEFGEDKGSHFIAMEFVEGEDLHTYVHRKGRLAVDEACEVLEQALRALQHAHEQGVVHRDIKPSNFLITHKNDKLCLKLADMGLARQQREEDFRLTRAGTTVGTIDYMAPEQARDSDTADGRSDIYSLGCTLFHMLTGRAPFPEGSIVERMYKHLETQPPDIRTLNAEVPGGLAYILARMLAKKPEQRYQTPQDALDDLARMDTLGMGSPSHPDILAGLLDAGSPAAVEPVRRRTVNPETSPRTLPRGGLDSPTVPSPRNAPAEPPAEIRNLVRPGWKEGPPKSKKPVSSRPANRAESTARFFLPPIEHDLPEDADDENGAKAAAETPAGRTRGLSNNMIYGLLGIAAALVVVAGVVASMILRQPRPSVVVERAPDGSPPPSSSASEPSSSSGSESKKESPPVTGGIRLISEKMRTVDVAALKRELEKPWSVPLPLPPSPSTLSVSRKFGEDTEQQVRSLTPDSFKAARDSTTVVEISDNGPLFLPSLAFQDCRIVLKAAKGYRPLLVWKVPRNGVVPSALLAMRNGNLTLEGIDVVLNWNEGPTEPAAFVSLVDSDFLASNCTFSTVGTMRTGLAAVRFEGGRRGLHCRMTGCLVRGNQLSALDVQSPAAEVLIESSLLVSNDRPLFKVAARPYAVTTIRLARSTAVTGDNLLLLRSTNPSEEGPTLQWIGWDSLLARCQAQPGGALVRLSDSRSVGGLQWRAVNCLYAGWKTLLDGPESIAGSDWPAWSKRFETGEGDRAIAECWPGVFAGEVGIRRPADFEVKQGAAVAYRSIADPKAALELLGCPITLLPTFRETWVQLAGDGAYVDYPDRFTDQPNIPVPESISEKFAGATLNPGDVKDLGAYLRDIASTRHLADKVVLHLKPGEWRTSPIRAQGIHLVICCDAGSDRDASPVTIEQIGKFSGQDALIEVQDGNLDIIGGRFQLRPGGYPGCVVKVSRGDLRMHGCRIQGPVPVNVDPHRSLIRVENAGDRTSTKKHQCVLDECVFFTGGTVLELAGTYLDVRMQQCLAAAGQDVLHLDIGAEDDPHLRIHCLLEQNTLAAKRAVVDLEDAGDVGLPLEPCIVAARGNMVWAPYSEPPTRPQPKSGVLLCQGDALQRGLLLWYGEGNAYDQRLYFLAAAADAFPARLQPMASWTMLWAFPDDLIHIPEKAGASFDLRMLSMADNLQTPSNINRKPLPGADLIKLGIVKRPKGS